MRYYPDTPDLYAMQLVSDLLCSRPEWHEWLGLTVGTEGERTDAARDELVWFGNRKSSDDPTDDDPVASPVAFVDLDTTTTHELPSRMARHPYNDTIGVMLRIEQELASTDRQADQLLEFVRRYNLVAGAMRSQNGKCCSSGWSMQSFNRTALSLPTEADDERVMRVEFSILVAGNFR